VFRALDRLPSGRRRGNPTAGRVRAYRQEHADTLGWMPSDGSSHRLHGHDSGQRPRGRKNVAGTEYLDAFRGLAFSGDDARQHHRLGLCRRVSVAKSVDVRALRPLPHL